MGNPPNIVKLKQLVHEDVFNSCKPALCKNVHDISAVVSEVFFVQEDDMRTHVLQVFCDHHSSKRVIVVFRLAELAVKESAKPAEPPAAYVRPAHLIRVSAERVTWHAWPQGAKFSLRRRINRGNRRLLWQFMTD